MIFHNGDEGTKFATSRVERKSETVYRRGTVYRRINRLNTKLKDRDGHVKYQSKELKNLEIEVGKLTLDLKACSLRKEELLNCQLTTKLELEALCIVSNNRQTEIDFLKKSKDDLKQTIKDRDAVIFQMNSTCNNLKAENKELNDRIARGISDCKVHAELINTVNSKLEKARVDNKKALDAHLTFKKEVDAHKQKNKLCFATVCSEGY